MIESIRSRPMQPGAYEVTNSITKKTTPEQFDEILRWNHEYNLEYGGRCGCTALLAATIEGNIDLIRHIVKIGGEHLLKIGNENGCTPLHLVSELKDFKTACILSKELIELGAEVNVHFTSDYFNKITPLIMAALNDNLQLVKLLLKNNAIVPDSAEAELGEDKMRLIKIAEKEIYQQKTVNSLVLASYLKPQLDEEGNEISPLKVLPPEMMFHIWKYLTYDPDVVKK